MTDGPHASPATIDLATARRVVATFDDSLVVESVSVLGEGVKSHVDRVDCSDGSSFALKLFKLEHAHRAETEVAFHRRIPPDAYERLHVPRMLAYIDDPSVCEQRVIVLEIACGVSLAEDRSLTLDQQLRIYRSIGAELRELHSIEVDRFGSLRPGSPELTWATNRELMEYRWRAALSVYVERDGNPAIAEALEEHFVSHARDWDGSGHAVLCQGDGHPGNFLFSRSGESIELTGVLDFESALGGDPLHDIALTYFSAFGDHNAKLAALLDGYGSDYRLDSGRLDLFLLYFALKRWIWFSMHADRPQTRVMDRLICRKLALPRRIVWGARIGKRLGRSGKAMPGSQS